MIMRRVLVRIVAPAALLAATMFSTIGFAPTQGGAVGAARAALHPVLPVTPRHAIGRSGLEDSLNWAGYAVTGTTMTSVSGSWIVPTVTCRKNTTQLDSTWVGLDGFASSDPTVEQIGTDSDCAKTRGSHHGTPTYYVWYEMYPAGAVLPVGYPVAPGELISGTVTATGPTTYSLSLTNGAWHFSVGNLTSPGQPQNASAEWITEAPSNCRASGCTVVPLPNFGILQFGSAQANGKPIDSSSFTSTEIDMSNKNGKKLRAKTSNLSGGDAFTVSWLHK
jgi:hypothetical protein